MHVFKMIIFYCTNLSSQPCNISIYGYITGLKREVSTIKNNHLKHMHDDIDKLHSKIDKLLYAILGGLSATIITLIGLFY